MKNLLLLILALLLAFLIAPLGILWAIVRTIFRGPGLSQFFLDCALSIDISGNVFFQHLFNDVMVPPDGYRFGKEGDTISYVLGHNKINHRLYAPGRWLSWLLNLLDPEHVEKAYISKEA
jgi:hypothetical protein